MSNNVIEIFKESILGEAFQTIDNISKYRLIVDQIESLSVLKDDLTNKIIAELGHDLEGQKSYDFSIYKITCKTPMIYVLDKEKYEAAGHLLPKGLVKEELKYTIDKKLCEHYLAEGDYLVRDIIIDMVTKKPSKPLISISLLDEVAL